MAHYDETMKLLSELDAFCERHKSERVLHVAERAIVIASCERRRSEILAHLAAHTSDEHLDERALQTVYKYASPTSA